MAKRKIGRPPAGVDGQRVRDYPQLNVRVPPGLFYRFCQRAVRKRIKPTALILRLMAREAAKS